jgi:hypothetical protein
MTAPLWFSHAPNAHAAMIKTNILPYIDPPPRLRSALAIASKCEYALFDPERFWDCHCAEPAALIFVMAETRETYPTEARYSSQPVDREREIAGRARQRSAPSASDVSHDRWDRAAG